ncbi:hypothetical protein BCR44DRAFT_1257893 [Catenaria anguillulae PL171]|uniref:Uncharacterized protein n=1 Tax=Catenaria anguillulae PL171 TaxID=765915 RepID=A0A1Y2HBR0_9FUNG|nr:hypothetical protein BCR44DRAFT_1257893 [Catenaria anguillulae PL171]
MRETGLPQSKLGKTLALERLRHILAHDRCLRDWPAHNRHRRRQWCDDRLAQGPQLDPASSVLLLLRLILLVAAFAPALLLARGGRGACDCCDATYSCENKLACDMPCEMSVWDRTARWSSMGY